MKEFLDYLQLRSSTARALKDARDEVTAYFAKPENQDLLVRNIRALMGLRRIGVEDLSTASMRNRSYVGRLIRKDFPNFDPSVETLRSMAAALKVKPSTLVLVDLNQKFQDTLDNLEQEN